MARSLKKSVSGLQKRASALNALIDKKTHPEVCAALQRAYAGLVASGQTLPRLERAAHSYVKRKIRWAKARPGPKAAADVVISFKVLVLSFRQLLDAASLMSRGRDVEVIKALGLKSLDLTIKIGAVLSGAKALKDAAEVVDILREGIATGRVTKLRREQVRVASDLLRWADAIALVALAWCYAAELFVLGTLGRGR
jgi:hypothetical protein